MSRSKARAWWATALVALTASSLITALPAGARAAEGPQACTLRPNPHVTTLNPWGSCVSVSAELAALPAVGESAQLTVEVTAQFARPDVRVEVDLPAGLEWEQVPAGLGTRQVAAATPTDRGGVRRAEGATALAAGGTKRFTGRVRATTAGPADIAVRAVAAGDEHSADPSDHVYLTVAGRGGRSTPGMAGSAHSAAAPVKVTAGRVAPQLTHRPAAAATAPVRTTAQREETTALAGTACVTGGWAYTDSTFAVRSSPNYGVQVWDRDTADGHDLLGVVATDSGGNYTVCFDNTDADGGIIDGGQDVYVRFLAENNMWRVQDLSGNLYSYDSTVVSNLAAGATHNYGQLQPTDPLHWLGVQAFDAVNDLWYWKPGDCWDDLDVGSCRQMVVNWRWDSAVGPHYDPNENVRQVFLPASSPISRDTTVHEATHWVMDDVYEFSPVPGAGGWHQVHTQSTAGLAWVEGFAEWTPTQVYNDPVWNWADGKTIDLESATWGSTWANPPLGTFPWQDGETVEGRVAGALIDLSDATNEAPWDRLSDGGRTPGHIWTTFLLHKSNTFAEFWGHRTADGFNTALTNGLASLYQNTIDFTFRDPLAGNTPVSRPTPPATSHNFSYNTVNNSWSVVALRPPAGADYNLRVYDDKAQTIQKGSSVVAGVTDFVAVNSNTGKTPLGDFYPKVSVASGTGGNYALELAQGSTLLHVASSQSVAMTSSKVVAVRDTMLTAGVPVTIKVTPGSASQDAELFIVGSVDGSSSTYVRSRATASAGATAGGPGAVETITFTPAVSGWHGVVLINKAGSGTYTLQRL
ncbi:hypothetical protein [Lentzea jiangxiensis]|uniref:M6 family metalloprotease domain-containing protein n=1 Tax=Lentzea jiangxiensis TaxID=641025 RepID=A0A1H0KQM9_9PSEU|nr:hypothetical protein [Lentzea jiangxiensis]SDO58081.1 hypothetical protein SAMN05421507_10327 [Lentzea jiangxiensis]